MNFKILSHPLHHASGNMHRVTSISHQVSVTKYINFHVIHCIKDKIVKRVGSSYSETFLSQKEGEREMCYSYRSSRS